MVLSFNGERFEVACKFAERHLPKKAGFIFDDKKLVWHTTKAVTASALREIADERAQKELKRHLIEISPWTGAVPHPFLELPKPFQLDAALFLLSRNRAYLAADPGLGKTIIAALTLNALDRAAVYICPPFLVGTVRHEMEKWLVNPANMPLVVADSMLDRRRTLEEIREFQATHPEAPLFVDEAHRYKNFSSNRAKAMFGVNCESLGRRFERIYFLSGTPLPNRPMELYPVLRRYAPETIDFMDAFQYGLKYCAGYKEEHGWNFSGASNVDELAAKIIGTFMLRLKKEHVMPELPTKTEELVVIDKVLPTRVTKLERAFLKEHSPEDLMKAEIGAEHLATYRRELGLCKVGPAVHFIRDILEDTDEKIVVFAIHRETIAKIAETFVDYNPFIVTGDTRKETRFAAATEFQTDPSRRLFIGNIEAAGLGFTLTAASRVIFVEYDWVPGKNDQAGDRVHRITQTKPVYIQYLVFKNSIDRAVMETVLRKKRTISQL